MKVISRKWFVVSFMLLTMLTLTGCFNGHSTVTGTYMRETDTGIRYLELTQVDKSVKGYAQALTASADQPEGIQLSKIDVSGDVDGEAIRLTLQSSVTWVQGTTLGGKWESNQITLNLADAKGTVEQARYKRVTVEEWNEQVRKFRDKCAQQVAERQREAAERQRERDTQATIERLREEQETIRTDLVRAWRSFVDNKNGLRFSLQALAVQNRNVETMEHRLERANSAVDKAERDARNGTERYQASQIRYTASQVNYQLGTVKYQRAQVLEVVSKFTNGVSQSKQEIAADNEKMSSTAEQLHTLSRNDIDSVTFTHWQLGQTIRATPGYSKPDVTSSILGTDPAGCYVAVSGKDQNWCFVASKTLSIIYLPVADVKILDEQP